MATGEPPELAKQEQEKATLWNRTRGLKFTLPTSFSSDLASWLEKNPEWYWHPGGPEADLITSECGLENAEAGRGGGNELDDKGKGVGNDNGIPLEVAMVLSNLLESWSSKYLQLDGIALGSSEESIRSSIFLRANFTPLCARLKRNEYKSKSSFTTDFRSACNSIGKYRLNELASTKSLSHPHKVSSTAIIGSTLVLYEYGLKDLNSIFEKFNQNPKSFQTEFYFYIHENEYLPEEVTEVFSNDESFEYIAKEMGFYEECFVPYLQSEWRRQVAAKRNFVDISDFSFTSFADVDTLMRKKLRTDEKCQAEELSEETNPLVLNVDFCEKRVWGIEWMESF